MFSRVQVEGFRSLRRIDQALGPFHALVGPNASGKTTVLDAVDLLGDLMRRRGDVAETVTARSGDFRKLVWLGESDRFRLAVEAPIPRPVLDRLASSEQRELSAARYEIEVVLDERKNEIGLDHERLLAVRPEPADDTVGSSERPVTNVSVLRQPPPIFDDVREHRVIAEKVVDGSSAHEDYVSFEAEKPGGLRFRLGRGRSVVSAIIGDPDTHPVGAWFLSLLEKGVRRIQLEADTLRRPGAPGSGTRLRSDGSNLPWVVDALSRDEARYRAWTDHVRTALDGIVSIETVERPEDRYRYIVVEYENGARVPSWLLSDGSLRVMALTILAYAPDTEGTLLIEEPENGIHPRAIETVMQSLGSVYDAQVLVATHSPIALGTLDASRLLCFSRDAAGATRIQSGEDHPRLREWQRGRPDLGVLFASGILSR